jgi:hypothetical protein
MDSNNSPPMVNNCTLLNYYTTSDEFCQEVKNKKTGQQHLLSIRVYQGDAVPLTPAKGQIRPLESQF